MDRVGWQAGSGLYCLLQGEGEGGGGGGGSAAR